MSVHERLRELVAEVQEIQVRPAAAVRARGRRRGRRQLAVVTAGVAVVAATSGVAAVRIGSAPTRTGAQPSAAVPLKCVLTLPDDPADVRVRVLDGGSAGLADVTAVQLRERRFVVLTGGAGGTAGDATMLSYGPAAIGAATLLRAELRGATTMSFDPGRPDDIVDLTLGTTFGRLASPTEVNEALVAVGEPSAPPQC
ncbi:LytR C-terminal domain-containing protein [Actinoplanes sp. NPDC026619]|uniref:LytR C-terminal domain-containing protein n=1 Tax=Actinoplanes sp. NPDC026619 TaxID=3155798 RepID=UPI0033F5B94E